MEEARQHSFVMLVMHAPTDKRQGARAVAIKWAARLMLTVLFGPFAVVYLFGFLDLTMPGGWFGHWFMGALTVAGAVATLSFAQSIKTHGPKELGCVLPLAAVTCWWGYIFLKDWGALK